MINWFKNLKIGARLIIGFSTMILFMAIIGFSGYTSVRNIQRSLHEIFTVDLPSIDYLMEADRDLQQLLVSERSMIFANSESKLFKGLVRDYEENLQQSKDRLNKYKALAHTAEEKAVISKYEEARKKWEVLSRKVVDGRVADTRHGRREALDLTLGPAKEAFEEMRNYLAQLQGIILDIAEKEHEEGRATYEKTIVALFSIIGAGLLIGILLMWVISRGVTNPLNAAIESLTESSDLVASASGQLASSSQQLAGASSEQAASIQETSSSLEEMSSMTKQNEDNADQANALMKETNQVVSIANRSMNELTNSMDEISKASEETSKIIKTIDEIAFQTNLLALNAAVEAARAGEAGAGFAVVADEVRNLAMRAADAAKSTSDLIEGTVKKVQDGSELVAITNETFTQVAKSSAKVGELVSEIAAASTEQAQGIEQVNKVVLEMDKATQQNAASAEESASASEEMNAQAVQMRAIVRELVLIVSGSTNGKGSGRGEAPQLAGTGDVKGLTSPEQRPNGKEGAVDVVKTRTRRPGEVRPDQVIPLDSKDFRDF